MSDSDKTTQDRGFLSRWSQRKQEAGRPEPKQDSPIVDGVEPLGPETALSETAEPEFDLSTLPKLEELTGTTDITAFLRKGVPEHLRNAALSKSWALDPAVRNYVNPALEYAYDWNTPGGVPGSSKLSAGFDVARMVSEIMGGTASAEAEAFPGDPDRAAAPSVMSDELKAMDNSPGRSEGSGQEPVSSELDRPEPDQGAESAAPNPAASQQPLRRHGTAKPIV
jgi:hypothetical protein